MSALMGWRLIILFITLEQVDGYAIQSSEIAPEDLQDDKNITYVSSNNLNGIIELSTLTVETTTTTSYDDSYAPFKTTKFEEIDDNGKQANHKLRKVLKHINKRPIHTENEEKINQEVPLKWNDSKKDLLTVLKSQLTDAIESNVAGITSGNLNGEYKGSIEGVSNNDGYFTGDDDNGGDGEEVRNLKLKRDHRSERVTSDGPAKEDDDFFTTDAVENDESLFEFTGVTEKNLFDISDNKELQEYIKSMEKSRSYFPIAIETTTESFESPTTISETDEAMGNSATRDVKSVTAEAFGIINVADGDYDSFETTIGIFTEETIPVAANVDFSLNDKIIETVNELQRNNAENDTSISESTTTAGSGETISQIAEGIYKSITENIITETEHSSSLNDFIDNVVEDGTSTKDSDGTTRHPVTDKDRIVTNLPTPKFSETSEEVTRVLTDLLNLGKQMETKLNAETDNIKNEFSSNDENVEAHDSRFSAIEKDNHHGRNTVFAGLFINPKETRSSIPTISLPSLDEIIQLKPEMDGNLDMNGTESNLIEDELITETITTDQVTTVIFEEKIPNETTTDNEITDFLLNENTVGLTDKKINTETTVNRDTTLETVTKSVTKQGDTETPIILLTNGTLAHENVSSDFDSNSLPLLNHTMLDYQGLDINNTFDDIQLDPAEFSPEAGESEEDRLEEAAVSNITQSDQQNQKSSEVYIVHAENHSTVDVQITTPESNIMAIPTRHRSNKKHKCRIDPESKRKRCGNKNSSDGSRFIRRTVFGSETNFSIEVKVSNSTSFVPYNVSIEENYENRALNFNWSSANGEYNYSLLLFFPLDERGKNVQLNLYIVGEELERAWRGQLTKSEMNDNEWKVNLPFGASISVVNLKWREHIGKGHILEANTSMDQRTQDKLFKIALGSGVCVVIAALAFILYYIVAKRKRNRELALAQISLSECTIKEKQTPP